MVGMNPASFTAESLSATNAHFRACKKKGELVDRVLEGRTTFEGELQDLFYFLRLPVRLRYLHNVPPIKEDHDTRLRALEELAQGVKVVTYEEEARYHALGRRLDELYRSMQDPGESLLTKPLITARQNIEFLRGESELGIQKLYAEPLSVYLNGMKELSSSVRKLLLLGTSGLVLSGSIKSPELTPVVGFAQIVLGSFLGLSIIGGFGYLASVPEGYIRLNRKLGRADAFVQKHKDLLL